MTRKPSRIMVAIMDDDRPERRADLYRLLKEDSHFMIFTRAKLEWTVDDPSGAVPSEAQAAEMATYLVHAGDAGEFSSRELLRIGEDPKRALVWYSSDGCPSQTYAGVRGWSIPRPVQDRGSATH